MKVWSEKLARAVAEALKVEARNPPDERRGSVDVWVEDRMIRICFQARDLSSARTLVNAYLSLVATAIDAVCSSGGV